MKVFVVTNPELGWDCVCGVFKGLNSLKHYFKEMNNIEDGSTESDSIDLMDEYEFASAMDEKDPMYIIHEAQIK